MQERRVSGRERRDHVLTKLDMAAAAALRSRLRTVAVPPIRYVGLGGWIDDLAPFDADAYVDPLFTDK
jgi:signal recognition particle GTPase